MAAATIEERLSALEQEVAQLKDQLYGERPGVTGRTRPDFLDKYTGTFANSPMFEEMVRSVEEERERERREARGEDDIEDLAASACFSEGE